MSESEITQHDIDNYVTNIVNNLNTNETDKYINY
jgi:hypothetical protein